MHIAERTLDDLLRSVTETLLARGRRVAPSRGSLSEIFGVLLELQDPRARLSRTEGRGKPFSCLGELLWYLSRSNRLDFIRYYVPQYSRESEDGMTVYGGYGRRLFNMRRRFDQVQNVLSLLERRPASRRAVIQLYDAADIASEHREIPCTCTLQFVVRDERLDMLTQMRSNDAYVGLPHDVFAFTMLQEIIAVTLGVRLGTYKHSVGSLHLYDRDRDDARRYLEEGVQSRVSMPRMPTEDPWPSIGRVLSAEAELRKGRKIDVASLTLRPYWADLVRLLEIHQRFKQRKTKQIDAIRKQLSTRMYDTYIADRTLRSTRS
jgi:thymidylate synthase